MFKGKAIMIDTNSLTKNVYTNNQCISVAVATYAAGNPQITIAIK